MRRSIYGTAGNRPTGGGMLSARPDAAGGDFLSQVAAAEARDELESERLRGLEHTALQERGPLGRPPRMPYKVACGSRHGSRRGGAPQRKERARGH